MATIKKKSMVDVSNEALEENEKKVVEANTVEIEQPIAEDTENGIEVNEEATNVKKSSSGQRIVKVRLRREHKCHIAGVNYAFEAGKTYTVPEAVKFILNRADLLAPL